VSAAAGVCGLYAGSFDPPTLGHLDIIRRAARVCDTLIVGIGRNPEKQAVFSVEQRVRLLRLECADIVNIQVEVISGATVDFARQQQVTVLIRGLRTYIDLVHERAMAEVNRANGFESLFLMTAGKVAHVSSSIVRQAMDAGLSLQGLVSPRIDRALRELRRSS
jgi:pantetheine-phosphate adenylyltransferase